jgi:hypothetical protein
MESDMNVDAPVHNNSDQDNGDDDPSNFMENTENNMPRYVTVLMRAMTWNRESYGLFDYESKNLK